MMWLMHSKILQNYRGYAIDWCVFVLWLLYGYPVFHVSVLQVSLKSWKSSPKKKNAKVQAKSQFLNIAFQVEMSHNALFTKYNANPKPWPAV